MPDRERRRLVAPLNRRSVHVPLPYRHPSPDDLSSLADLMLDAYRGTIDGDGETRDDALDEVRSFFEGKAGAPLLDCSFVALDGDRPVSASLIALQDGQPLAAYVYTGAAWKNRGLAHALLECSMDALAGAGYTTLALWVTAGNVPAERVYRALGFQ
jgi:GNAT superfamily N-acetyltransferase